MIPQIIAGAVFAVTIYLAASDVPPKTRLSKIISAVLLGAADILMLTRFSAASAEYEQLLLFLNENKEASVELFPKLLAPIAEGIHNVIISAAKLLQQANGAVLGFFDGTGDIAAFVVTAMLLSLSAIILMPEKEESESGTVSPAKAIGLIVLGLFTDSFFAAPVAAAAMYGLCCLMNVGYAAVICTVMWVLSYIPIIGQAAGIILGVCILIAACHPVWGIIFGIVAAAVHILLSSGKNIIEGALEARASRT